MNYKIEDMKTALTLARITEVKTHLQVRGEIPELVGLLTQATETIATVLLQRYAVEGEVDRMRGLLKGWMDWIDYTTESESRVNLSDIVRDTRAALAEKGTP